MRIGQGYDVHRLAEDRSLILGGVMKRDCWAIQMRMCWYTR